MSQNSNYQDQTPDMPMKGHKFLIYFWLWFLAAVALIQGYSNITSLGEIQQSGYADAIQGLPLVYLQTALLFILGLYLIKVRFDLAKFKASAPGSLSKALILTACVGLITVIFMVMNNIPSESNSEYIGPIINIFTMLSYRRYYNARDKYFVN